MQENTSLLGKGFKDLLIPPSIAKCAPINPGLWSSSQVALRVRPISVAELEEGATLIAHKVDEQVLGAAGWRLAQLACHTHLAGHGELCVSPRQPLGGLSTASPRGSLLLGRLPRSAQGKPRAFGAWVGPDHKIYFCPHAVNFPIYARSPQGTHLAGPSRNHL